MFNIIFREFLDLKLTLLALAISGLVSATLSTLSVGILFAGIREGGSVAEQLVPIAGFKLSLVGVTILLCLPVVVRLAIQQDSRKVAFWQIIGASYFQIRKRYILLSTFAILFGSSFSLILSAILWPLFAHYVVHLIGVDVASLHDGMDMWAVLGGVGASTCVSVIAVGLFSGSLVRIEPVQAVRPGPEIVPKTRLIQYVIVLLGLITVAAAYAGIASLPATTDAEIINGLTSAYWVFALWLIVLFALIDRVVIKSIAVIASKIVSCGSTVSGLLAAGSARRRVTLSTAVITPMVVASGTVGSIFGMVAQSRNIFYTLNPSAEFNASTSEQLAFVFAFPVIIAAFTGLSAVLLTSRSRLLDIRLLLTLGVKVRSVVVSIILEVTIYLFCAIVVVTVILGANALAYGYAVGRGPIPGVQPIWFGTQAYWTLLAGFVVLLAAILIPSANSTRKDTSPQIEW